VDDKYLIQKLTSLSTQVEADFKTTLSPGMWQVKCILTDTSTSIRTPEVRDLARQEHLWNIITT